MSTAVFVQLSVSAKGASGTQNQTWKLNLSLEMDAIEARTASFLMNRILATCLQFSLLSMAMRAPSSEIAKEDMF
jgi:hypothetical protein